MVALIAAARAVLIGLGALSAGQSVVGLATGDPGLAIQGVGALTGAIPLQGRAVGFGGIRVRRHRRRKALTANDLSLALTIATAISKKAAEVFILQRVRRG